MRGLVYSAGDHAWRARRSDEVGPRQQIRSLYRNHRRQNGHAAGPRLRARPAEGHVRRDAIISWNEFVERAAITFPLSHDERPAQCGLRAREHEDLEMFAFIMNGHTPFAIVILEQQQ